MIGREGRRIVGDPVTRWIPSAITLLGLFAALLSMSWAGVEPYWSCLAIIAASLFDMIDGRIARLLGAQSDFGAQLDSLVDAVAFGVAPAWLAFHVGLSETAAVAGVPIGIAVAFSFAAATAIRLAKFNLGDQPDNAFVGIPSPVGALLVTTFVMVAFELELPGLLAPWTVAAVTLGAAALMVSPVEFPSYKRFKTRWGRLVFYGAIGGGLTMLFLQLPGGTVLASLLTLYVVRGVVTALSRR